MEWTFGIITGGCDINIDKIITSIEQQNIPKNKYEIIIVGNCILRRENTTIIDFNENIKPMWISKKKNIITQKSKFKNISYLHDYITFEKDWYSNFIKFGEDWDVCMNSIKNPDNTRFRDWVMWCPKYIPYNNEAWIECLKNVKKFPNKKVREWDGWGPKLISYEDHSRLNHMYISGSYFCAKKEFMIKYPFDENLCWGEGEDVEWSLSVRNFWNYKCNKHSSVKFLKYKHDVSLKE